MPVFYSAKQLQKKREYINLLLSDTTEYYESFHKGIRLATLSAKYSRAFEKLGGFKATLDELSADGSIDVILKESGGKLVYPGGAVQRLPFQSVLLKK